jgi:hypothetical protein
MLHRLLPRRPATRYLTGREAQRGVPVRKVRNAFTVARHNRIHNLAVIAGLLCLAGVSPRAEQQTPVLRHSIQLLIGSPIVRQKPNLSERLLRLA